MSEEIKDILGMLAHGAKKALHTTGKKASAAALRSLMKDGKKLVKSVDSRFDSALRTLAGIAPEEDEAESEEPEIKVKKTPKSKKT